MTVRTHVRLEERTAALLEQTGNKSRYIAEVVGQRWRSAQTALAWLKDEGWTLAQIRQAMGLLSTSWEQGLGACDAAQPMRQLTVMRLGESIDERACRALCLLAGEWWADNTALKDQLQEAPAPKATRRPAQASA